MDLRLRSCDCDDPSCVHSADRDSAVYLSRAQGAMGHTHADIHGSWHCPGRSLSTLLALDESGKSSLSPYLARHMALLAHEQFRTLYLDQAGEKIVEEKAWSGSATEVDVPVPEIFRTAIALDAGSLIFAHNHPSGDPHPSRQDVDLTRTLSRICRQLEIPLYDHIIVGRNRSFSFREQGLL